MSILVSSMAYTQDKPSNVFPEQYKHLVGTWLFTKATAGESDFTTKYPFGYLNGKTKKRL